jgi:hypothetical protein
MLVNTVWLDSHSSAVPMASGAYWLLRTVSSVLKNSASVTGGCRPSFLKIFLLYRKPWMTEATGMQKVSLPSSVCHATREPGAKFSMPALPFNFSK